MNIINIIESDFFLSLIRTWLVIAALYYISISITYICLFLLSLKIVVKSKKITKKEKQKYKKIYTEKELEDLPSISVLVPAYNEEVSIVDSIKNLFSLYYKNYEIIVVNDGSKDKTLERVIKEFDMVPSHLPYNEDDDLLRDIKIINTYKSRTHPHLVLIDKSNGGKSTALNTAIYFSRSDLFCAMDADSIIMKDALVKTIGPFLEDRRTIAVGGILRVGNGIIDEKGNIVDRNMNFDLLPLLQTIEYERDFKLGRLGWYALQSTILVSGAFGVFNKNAVRAVGGYNLASIGEDLELIMRMHNVFCKHDDKPYRVVFVPEETCWTETPSSLKVLYNQRNRWQRGLMDSFSINKDVLFNPEHGVVGMLSVPYYFMAELYGPIIKYLNYIIIAFAILSGIVSLKIFILILIISFLFRVIINFATLLLDNLYFNEKPRIVNFLYLSIASFVDGLGYKQFISIATLGGFMDYFRKVQKWGKMERKGMIGKADRKKVD